VACGADHLDDRGEPEKSCNSGRERGFVDAEVGGLELRRPLVERPWRFAWELVFLSGQKIHTGTFRCTPGGIGEELRRGL